MQQPCDTTRVLGPDRPAHVLIEELQTTDAVHAARQVLAGPRLAAVDGLEDDGAAAGRVVLAGHPPGVVVDEADGREDGGVAQRLRDPGLAAVGGAFERRVGAGSEVRGFIGDRPAVRVVDEIDAAQLAAQGRGLGAQVAPPSEVCRMTPPCANGWVAPTTQPWSASGKLTAESSCDAVDAGLLAPGGAVGAVQQGAAVLDGPQVGRRDGRRGRELVELTRTLDSPRGAPVRRGQDALTDRAQRIAVAGERHRVER